VGKWLRIRVAVGLFEFCIRVPSPSVAGTTSGPLFTASCFWGLYGFFLIGQLRSPSRGRLVNLFVGGLALSSE